MPGQTLPIKTKPESATLTELLHSCQSDSSHVFGLCSSQADQIFDVAYFGNHTSPSLLPESQLDAVVLSQSLNDFSESLRLGLFIRAFDLVAN